jgi:uncharacterized protein
MKFDPRVNKILETISSNSEPEPTRDYSLSKGLEFYNNGEYFEAHEIWEFQWKKEKGSLKLLLQAWIQIAVSLHKIKNKPNKVGAKSQAEKALTKLQTLQSDPSLKHHHSEIYNLIEYCKSIIDSDGDCPNISAYPLKWKTDSDEKY